MQSRQQELPHQAHLPLPPPPNELVIKTKMNGWLNPSGIQPVWLACLPLPEGAKYTAVKTAIVNIANLLEYLEEATSYTHLWAGFTRGITIPETFICIFDILRCQIVHDYYLNMVLGYIIYQHVAAATTQHFNCDALNGLLITLAVFQCQVPNFPQIWEEIFSQPSNAAENNWTQARSFACYPSCHPPLFGLTFVLPDTPTGPWEIRTQWSEQELTALARGTAKPLALCQCVHSHMASLESTPRCQHPQVHP
jgi:hypothetical protein